MSQKVEWYREVLELEPGSKVFFPLAKLLVADGKFDEAVTTLRQGLLRHPEHVEARLLLVELLATYGQDAHALQQEVASLGTLLRTYPGFWDVWSADLASLPEMQDAVLALRFFAAALQGKPITWAKVIEQGLRSILHTTPSPHLAEKTPCAPLSSCDTIPPPSSDTPANVVEEAHDEPLEGELVDEDDVDELHDSADIAQELPPSRPLLPRVTVAEPAVPEEGDEEDEEVFSLRTRSMADVLAEQGDIAGAIDIYKELIAAATPADLPELQKRLDELSTALEHPPVQSKDDPASQESRRLAELMEGLAQRLEARSR